MDAEQIYTNLSSVKIVKFNKNPRPFSLFFWFNDELDNTYEEPEMWTAIFHKKYKKYLVTNDINKCGLNDSVKNLEIVGYADDLNYIMLVIYEHQKSIGFEKTIQDEIKEIYKKHISELASREWKWAKPKKEQEKETSKNIVQ